VINRNLHSISYCFQVIADYWSNLCHRQGVPVFNTVVCGEILKSGPRNLAQETKRIPLSWCWYTDRGLLVFCLPQSMHLTNREIHKQKAIARAHS